MFKDIKSELSVKKIVAILLLLATMIFVMIQKDCFLSETLDRFDITKNNKEKNTSEMIPLRDGSKVIQPFKAKTSKIQTVRLYFSNVNRYENKVKAAVYITDKKNKIVGAKTVLTSDKIAHKAGTQIVVNGNTGDINDNGIVKIKKASKDRNDVDIKEGKTYYIHIEISDLKISKGFGIYLLKPGNGKTQNPVSIDGKEMAGSMVLYSITYYLMSYWLIILLLALLMMAILFILLPLSAIGERRKQKKGKETDLNKLLLRIMFIATPFFVYFDLSKIASFSTRLLLLQLFSIKGLLNLFILGMIWWLFYTITNRIKLTIILTTLLGFIFGLANYLLILFRNSPLLAMDLLSWKTGLAVAGTYNVTFNKASLWLIVLTMIWICIAVSLKGHKGLPLKKRLIPVMISALWIGGFYFVIFTSDILPNNKIRVNQFNPNWTYRKNGYALSFVASIRTSIMRKPEGYDVKEIKKIAAKYPSDKALKATGVTRKSPNIIVIMNESFSDLKYMADFDTNKDYMPFVRSMKENTIKGTMHTSVLGSRTADTELEFLTGTSMQFFPEYSVPYVSMIQDKKPAMAWDMDKMNYGGDIAYHPGMVDSYNRNNVYPLLGFKKHLSLDDMKDPKLLRAYVSDEQDYEYVIDQYEKNKKTKKPFYMFNVTIQNHGGYLNDTGIVNSGIKILDTKLQDEQAIQYLNLIHESDKAIGKFIEYFKNQSEPTVVVFFGDHEPVVGDGFYTEMDKRMKGMSSLERYERRYRVPFFIWANYDIKEEENVEISPNYLQAYTMNKIGMPLTGFQKYLLDVHKKMPAISAIAGMDSNGRLFDTKEKNPLEKTLREYEKIQYNNFFDKENRINEFYYLK